MRGRAKRSEQQERERGAGREVPAEVRAWGLEDRGLGRVVPPSDPGCGCARTVDAGVDKPVEPPSTPAAHSHAGWEHPSVGDQTHSRCNWSHFAIAFGRQPKGAWFQRGVVATEVLRTGYREPGSEGGSGGVGDGWSIPQESCVVGRSGGALRLVSEGGSTQ